MRLLYIHPGLMPPPQDERMDKFFFLSREVQGDVLMPVWWANAEEARANMGDDAFPVRKVGEFSYHMCPAGGPQGFYQKASVFLFYIRTGTRLHRERPFDCIVTYGHTLTGVAGVLLKLLTGTKLVVEINCEPGRAQLFQGPSPSLGDRLKQLGSVAFLHFSVLCADMVKLLYPKQLSQFELLRGAKESVFHDFVATSLVRAEAAGAAKEESVLLVGYPWYTKGVDVLIRAFRIIQPEFPQVKLRILGFLPDVDKLTQVVGDCSWVEFLGARPQAETIRRIAQAMVLAHPARTEGMGRVLLEAMSAKTAIVASAVGGIPHYVKDGLNGLLCVPEDVESLAAKLRTLLSDAALRERLQSAGFDLANTTLDETSYVKEFSRMLAATLSQTRTS
jgi:glycosyltransferase involved in cell wall biosynthesis